MRKYIGQAFLFTALSAFSTFAPAQVKTPVCGTDYYIEEQNQNPETEAQYNSYLSRLTEIAQENVEAKRNSASKAVVTVPVVFHIIHEYGEENISRAQIMDQLRIINEDFRRNNPDRTETRSMFQGRAADLEVEFALARVDPDGNCTDGITRTVSPLTDGGDEAVKELINWGNKSNSSRHYLNIWVVKRIDRGAEDGTFVAGYATLPQQGANSSDGIVIMHNFIGSIGTSTVGRAGRTLTHEIGHWLGLLHPFQNGCGGSNCSTSGDRICDTPPVFEASFNCPTNNNTCSNDNPNEMDMVENYMDYANGSCQNAFTAGQKAVTDFFINNSSFRGKYVSSGNLSATGVNNTSPCIPIADFHTSDRILTVCAGTPISFEDLSWNGEPTDRLWTFEGGNPSTSTFENPTITYSQGGVYSVSLKATNSSGEHTTTKNQFVRVIPAFSSLKSPFQEGFESANSSAAWDMQKTGSYGWERINSPTYSGDFAIRCYIDANSEANSRYSMTSPAFDLSVHEGLSPVLSFRSAYSLRESNSGELLVVYASSDCGKTWTALGGILGAATLKSIDGNNPNWAPSSPSDWTTHYIELGRFGFDAQGNLMLRFEITSRSGNAVYIDDINIDRIGLSAPSLEHMQHQFSLYPNPSTGGVKIRIHAYNKPLTVDLLDYAGRTIGNLSNEQNFINGGELKTQINNSGVYFVRFKSQDGILVKKLIITQ
jgi:PKD repeat protein